MRNPEARKLNMSTRGTLFTVSAPSGAGKTSLVTALVDSLAGIQVSVSHTTRAQRPGEVDGVNYHFIDQATFTRMLAETEFLEHAQVFTNYYGTSRSWVENALAAGVDVILEIDWQGAQQVRKILADTVSVFILPPSRETLLHRLTGRGQDSDEVIAKRMAEAKSEISHYVESHYLLVNDQFDTALAEFRSIIVAERQKILRQAEKHQALIASLLS